MRAISFCRAVRRRRTDEGRALDLVLVGLDQGVMCLDQRFGIPYEGQRVCRIAEVRVLLLVVGKCRPDEPEQTTQLLAAFADLVDDFVRLDASAVDVLDRLVDLLGRGAPQTVLDRGVV
jgi:hypothetical protein